MGVNLQQRKELLVRLGEYITGSEPAWEFIKDRAFRENGWFIPEYIDNAVKNIAGNFLQEERIQSLIETYSIPEEIEVPKRVGIVMAGNLPLVGFHDLFCVFLSGHIAFIKPSSKDEVLIRHLIDKLVEWSPAVSGQIMIGDMLKNCDAYIATGSNNTSRYFEYYFRKYPSIIRKNRTSVAVLSGQETVEELERLADDVFQYFGLGCRNVTKLYVPRGYDFIPLLQAFKKYEHLANHNKYKNNYDFNLAVLILNKNYYMTNESILLVESPDVFSPIGQLNYEFYDQPAELLSQLKESQQVQCIVGAGGIPFGTAQCPAVTDYADGVDTLRFLRSL